MEVIDVIDEAIGSQLKSVAEKINSFDYIKLLHRISETGNNYFFWHKEDEKLTILGVGETYSIKISGNERTFRTGKAIEALHGKVSNNWDSFHGVSFPLLVGGMKFAPNGNGETWKDFADSEWFIPKYLFLNSGNEFYFVHNFFNHNSESDVNFERAKGLKLLDEHTSIKLADKPISIIESNLTSESEKKNWFNLVNKALEFIKENNFKKIVLSREVKMKLSDKPIIANLINILIKRYPHCYVFIFNKNSSVFFGASPEKLAKFKNGWIEADALAGSTPRGKDEKEDKLLEEQLLNSVKNLNEQKTVVEFITSSFRKFSDELEYSDSPIVRKLPNIQHLWTPIKAKIDRQKPLFSILEEVHPTPAICGAPWTAAMESILSMETHNRGLYTGAVGWFNLFNEGEFAVAIRSAILRDKKLSAYAGCGIVKGSVPEIEFEETKLKLKPILNLFKNEN